MGFSPVKTVIPPKIACRIVPRVGKEEKITLDLATFPIPYNLFIAWFYKHVIEPKRETYDFYSFVKDFFNNCVFVYLFIILFECSIIVTS